ncbi:MAG: TRAP-type C4-dicarboxylate transport system, periplasmic component [Firmicutes bacterium]|nr:TRAP-type C4-dicarboxylate transport system, periplasmic component [Bacillota bacterium]MDI6704805.1 TRAP transporter substrate-binding protein [Bacillota bacterium]
MKKSLMYLLCLILAVSLVGGCAQKAAEEEPAAVSDEPIKLRLAHVVNEKDGFHVAALKFKELVEQKTGGKVQIDIYPNATLGDERTLLEGMQMGTVDMGVITNGPVANFLPEIAVFELPFLFSNPAEAYSVLDGDIGQELLNKLETVQLKGLAYAERGFRNLTNSKRAVNTPDDVKGLKIRVMENPVYIDTFQALGANTVPMAWTEALTALQQKTIDGQENPVNVIYSYKLSETQKYLSMTRHTYAPAIFVMSLDKFNQLPEGIQTVFKECAQEAAEYERQVNADNEAQQLDEIENQGMEVIREIDTTPFKEAVKSVYDKYGDKFGNYLTRIQEQLK